MRGAIYTRYSSAMQKETSIEDQLRECKKYAEVKEIQVVMVYADSERTGRNDQREDFQKMLKDASKGLFDVIIVYELTRFARNKYESAINKYHLKKHGVRVISATEQIPDTAEGILMETLLEGIAEYQSVNLAKNFMRGKKGIALDCRHTGGRPLLGYKVVKEAGKKGAGYYAIDEDTAPAVRLLFDMYANGAGFSEIIDTLNAKGYKTAAGRTFGKNSLNALLKNERYIGTYIFNKIATAGPDGKRNSSKFKPEDDIIRVENGIPAIIDKDTWERVQKRMEANKKAPARAKANTNYLLTGKIFCGKCGGAMVGQPSQSRAGIYYYYNCCTKKRLRTCDKKNVKKEWIESLVIKHLRLSLTEKNIDYIATKGVAVLQNNTDQLQEITRMNKRLGEIQKALGNIMTAIEQGIFTEETRDRIAELEGEKGRLEQAVTLAQLTHVATASKESISEYLRQFRTEEDDQRLIDFLLKAVYVYDDEIIITGHFDQEENGQKISLSDIEKGAREISPIDSDPHGSADSHTPECADMVRTELSAPRFPKIEFNVEEMLNSVLFFTSILSIRSLTAFWSGAVLRDFNQAAI